MATILLVGEDDLLQQTRAAVLRTTGADTICSNADLALAVQADRECDLVVLCHSLPEPRCSALAEAIHARWPRTQILLLTPARAWESANPHQAIDAITSADPKRLIVRSAELLGNLSLGRHRASRTA
jgi:DNA-binding NtrC family response regulator